MTLSDPNHDTAFIEEAAFQVHNFLKMQDFLTMFKQIPVSPMYLLLLFINSKRTCALFERRNRNEENLHVHVSRSGREYKLQSYYQSKL